MNRRIFVSALISICLFSSHLRASVTYDTNAHNAGIGASPATVSITVGSLTEGAVAVAVFASIPVGFSVTSVTVGGSTATLISNSTATAFQCFSAIYGIAVGTTSGAKSVVITYSGSAFSVSWAAISASGVDQTTPFNNGANEGQDSGGALSLAVTSASSDLCFDFVQGNNSQPAGNTQTLVYAENTAATGSSRVTTPAASVTFAWTGNNAQSHSAANFKASGGSTYKPQSITLLGTGK